MLEKDKNCIEFSMHSMMATHKPYQEETEIAITGMAPGKSLLLANNPFDIPCDVVVVSKRYFERLQTDNQHYREMAKQLEESYKDLIDKTGFYNFANLMYYLPKDKTLKDIIDNCETENKELKKKLAVPDPFAEYKELFEKLRSKEDVEKFEWTLNHFCGGQASANGWMVTAKLWRRNYETLSKLVGFSSTEEIQDYLTNEAECDTLNEAIFKLIKENKYAYEEWYKANSSNNSWKAAAECNSPKELIEKHEALEKEIEVYSSTLKEWKEGTGCPSPSAAKTLIESGASWHHAYNESKEVNKKFADSIKSWQNVTGYATPNDYIAANIHTCYVKIEPSNITWQKATGCDSPCDAKKRIKALNERIDESEACYNHLLALTGFGSEGEIEDALDKCDHSSLRKALVDYEFDYEELLKLTGYKSNQDIRVLLHGDKRQYYHMRDLINTLKRNSEFSEANWKAATGCDTPGRAEEKLEYYKKRLGNAVQAANCATKHLENITF